MFKDDNVTKFCGLGQNRKYYYNIRGEDKKYSSGFVNLEMRY